MARVKGAVQHLACTVEQRREQVCTAREASAVIREQARALLHSMFFAAPPALGMKPARTP